LILQNFAKPHANLPKMSGNGVFSKNNQCFLQHLFQELVRPSSALKELAQKMKEGEAAEAQPIHHCF